jgi:NAD(P)-dependent dehydrogenase (short-subunit alcohol dehydrogenase family)
VTDRSPFDLAGRAVLLTGASSMLGQAFAHAMHAAGARIALVARRSEALETLAGELPGAVPVVADLADLAGLAAVVARAREQIGPIDTLVNAAARGSSAATAEAESLEQVAGTLTVNLAAPLVLAQLVYPDMRAAGRGWIVNVGSIAGEVGIGRIPQASYAASKGGLHALTRELAAQWSRCGIRVNTLAPGFFESEMTAVLYETPKLAEWIERGQMLPGATQPSDLVGALMFLISDASATMTGQTLIVDNGWTAR